MEDFVEIGKIRKLHGYKGQVAVSMTPTYAQVVKKLGVAYLGLQGKATPFFVSAIQGHSDKWVLTLEDIDNEIKAKELLGLDVFLPHDKVPEEFLPQDDLDAIIGFEVWDQEKGLIGVVHDWYDQSHQELISVMVEGNEVLIPVHESIVLKADRRKKKLMVHLPDGLIELYTQKDTLGPTHEN